MSNATCVAALCFGFFAVGFHSCLAFVAAIRPDCGSSVAMNAAFVAMNVLLAARFARRLSRSPEAPR